MTGLMVTVQGRKGTNTFTVDENTSLHQFMKKYYDGKHCSFFEHARYEAGAPPIRFELRQEYKLTVSDNAETDVRQGVIHKDMKLLSFYAAAVAGQGPAAAVSCICHS